MPRPFLSALRVRPVDLWRGWREMGTNPVVVREARARWRGARPFVLALLYAGFLSVVLWFGYRDNQLLNSDGTTIDLMGASAQLGHDMFTVLCFCQVGAWLLIAPALTASAIAGEREKGLLEGLLLSRLSPAQIVRGKLASALSLVVLLALVGIPVMAVCFLLGGVSSGELVGALLIQLSTAFCGASIGLFASCTHKRSSSANGGAIASIVLWMIATGGAFYLMPDVRGNTSIPIWSEMMALIGFSNPFLAAFTLTSPFGSSSGDIPSGAWKPVFEAGYGWAVSILGQLLIAAWRLNGARQILSRPPERFDDIPTALPNANPAPAARPGEPTPPVVVDAASPGHYWQVPILKRVVFGNALLRRELLSAWRWGDLSVRSQIALTFAGLGLSWAVLQMLLSMFQDENAAEGVWWGIFVVGASIATLVCATSPASGVARERENGVWEALRLTLLSPLQITVAKVAAPLVACLGYGAVTWPILLLAIWRGEVALHVWMSCILLALLVCTQVASWSVLCGTQARVPASALGWGLGGPIAVWAGVPLLDSMLNLQFFASSSTEWMTYLHPFAAFDAVSNEASYNAAGDSVSGPKYLALGLQASVAVLLFALAVGAVSRSQRAQKRSAARTS